MDSLRITCAAITILLLATSCIEQLSAYRGPHPWVSPDRPGVESSAPGDSVAKHIPERRTDESSSIALLRELRAGGTRLADPLRGPYRPGEYGDTWEHGF